MTRLLPAREAERLEALRRLAIGAPALQPHFDAVCRLACEMFDVPIATIAFIDRERSIFKAKRGLDIEEAPRCVAFCARTILFDEPLVVADATVDRRFSGNPFVTGRPGIRFYAGVPLALRQGLNIGTLCIIDTAPRAFPAEQIRRLRGLAALVVAYLRLHEAALARADAIAEGRRLVESLAAQDDRRLDETAHLSAQFHALEAPLAM